jgi:hypothetical protein
MPLSLLLDLVMIFLLAGTIYFVWRLSEQLNRFRQNRADMDRVVRELNIAIERSQVAINGMRAAADTAGAELQKKILSATELSDELQLMSESGNALATRLERAAGTSSDLSSRIPQSGDPGPSSRYTSEGPGSGLRPVRDDNARDFRNDVSSSSFAIRDPEFDAGRPPDEPNDFGDDDDFGSDAERELFKAIKKNKTVSRSVV